MDIYPGSACACVNMCAHARVCVRMCFVLQVLGQVLHGAGAHVCRAPGAVQECRAPGAEVHVCHAAGAGAGAGAGAAGAGAGAGARPSPLITVHPPTKLYFRQSRATPEPQNKYMLNDTGTTPEGKKCYLPGMISERYSRLKSTKFLQSVGMGITKSA